MKNKYYLILLAFAFIFFQNCASTQVIDAWKAEPSVVALFKEKNVLVIARTENNQARLAFEIEIAKALKAQGINATESYRKSPNIYPNREISEERVAEMESLMASEGFTAIVLTVIKDKQITERTSTSGVYMGASYSNYYPSHYGGFYNYYRSPYAYGSYYNSFGGYIPTSTETYIDSKYVLETVFYNLDEETENQLVAVVTTNIDNPKEAYKAAEKYVALMVKHLQDK